MNQNQPPTMPQQPFTGTHNHIYETLRKYLMQLHSQGVPGMDEVLNALNKSHIKQMGQMQQPMQPQQMQQPQQPPQMPQQGGF